MAADDGELLESDEQLVLGELLNHVLDKGVVISGDVTISVANIDLVRVGLSLYLTSVETMENPSRVRGDLPVLPD
ncbi:MAG TPA: gas vesicle protein [Gemmatimonadaceae bacterium]